MRSEVVSTATEEADPVREVQDALLGQAEAKEAPVLSEATVARFWSKVDRSGGPDACWPWKAALRSTGYGIFSVARFDNRSAHRIAHMLSGGTIPEGLFVCHHCDNRLCCNPAHLIAASAKWNSHDAKRKGRLATGQRQGAYTHPERHPRGERHGSRTKPERVARGERSGTSRLTENDVRAIRFRAAEGASYKMLGLIFGVSGMQVRNIVLRLQWAWLE